MWRRLPLQYGGRPAGGTVALKNRAHVPVGEGGRADGAASASSND